MLRLLTNSVRLLPGQSILLARRALASRALAATVELRDAGRRKADGLHTASGLMASQSAAQLLEMDCSHHGIVGAAAAGHRGRVETERVALEIQSVHEEVQSV